jgi:predicted alpha/beta superfamily hydrolase
MFFSFPSLFASVIMSSSLCLPAPSQGGEALGVTGTIKHHPAFESEFVDPRNVDIWLPPGYNSDSKTCHPVVYMHDGQNLFDPALSFIGVDWDVDGTMTRLIHEGKVREAIIVGIWNTPKRLPEYMPKKPVRPGQTLHFGSGFPDLPYDEILSDEYLKFIVHELKPFVDAQYRTCPDQKDTFIMGSSMGGLISAYALCEYPTVFSGAGCVSTHWPADDGSLIRYFETHLPDSGTHKFYFDYGTETTDAAYEPYQLRVNAVLEKVGFVAGADYITKKFEGAEHSERAWRERVDQPLTFFLAP